jgi:hypothetical protein
MTTEAADLPVVQARTGGQPQDRQGARPHGAAVVARARRSGDRVAILFAAVHESAVGIKRTVARFPTDVRFER